MLAVDYRVGRALGDSQGTLLPRELAVHFVYSPAYFADLGAHVFPVAKYRMIAARLTSQGVAPTHFVEPEPASFTQLLRVHTSEYLDDLMNCRFTPRTAPSEMRLTPEIVALFVLNCGGTIRAANLALDEKVAVHIGGGFHHAFADRAEGFCYVNDLAVAVRELQAIGRIHRAMVLDCDVHQGNGTAKIFQGDTSVFTFSIHQYDLYPEKEVSDLDVHLPDGVKDEEYLQHLSENIPRTLDEFRPDLVLYQAGADPYERDSLGDLKLTIDGLKERDRRVINWAVQRSIPLAVTLGGGYAVNTADTVTIHTNTCTVALDAGT
jgi:acetoin utilization deacetylase AcuC-like enzyme